MSSRIAAAPISWGVCEVPNWGFQLAPETVLNQMRELGVLATEFGPEGFLPVDPAARATVLAEHGMHAVGGFVPVIFHKADHDPLPGILAELAAHVSAGASTIVYAAASGDDGYDERPVLTDDEWQTLFSNLERARQAAVDAGIVPTLHPHVGTIIETGDDVRLVLERSSIGLCLDTGHLLIGGTDPQILVDGYADRITHTHLKDVRESLANRVRAGEITYYDAVTQGMYCPLGTGDANIGNIVRTLEAAGYSGWYTMEQDTVLNDESEAAGALADVRSSMEFLLNLGV
ncbi:inosose dehydratase [Lysinibacter cavernae]|uniref:Inosose dehydratase n=1 Tax=Lysinibacter cavernae TaxID=1640652 RepID=A0A7X5QZW7_9MICO|nr:inosose dehydratase [Lysinibacter cavernae]